MNNLRFFREKAGLTQSDLAGITGFTRGAISHFEKGRRGMDRDLCRVFVKILNNAGASVGLDDVLQNADRPEFTLMQHYETSNNDQKTAFVCALIGKVIEQDRMLRASTRAAGITVKGD